MIRRIGKPVKAIETGVIRKSWNGRITIALIYPNTYSVGMSNLGFQTVYALFNSIENIVCERAFLPEENDPGKNRVNTIESQRPISDFDIIAFSISFESDYLNVVRILAKAGIPLQSTDRAPPTPLVIAGGVACFLNPEPISSVIDCFLIGEAEQLIPPFAEAIDFGGDRETCLKALVKKVSGIYVPAFYRVEYHKDDTLKLFEPIWDVPAKIRRAVLEDVKTASTHTVVLTPNTTFSNTFLIEVNRGCPHGCRFCSAGYIYRPPRFRPLSFLSESLKKGIALTDKIGLAGSAVSDHPHIKELCAQAHQKDIALSFSSLRADALSPELIETLRKSHVKTATIAPDAGSLRMRRIINKSITEENVLEATHMLISSGIPNLKLYFMVGLPKETMDDVNEIVLLCKKIKTVFLKASQAKKRIGEITISLNPFIPKPFTPFQWAAMDALSSIKQKIGFIKESLKKVANIRVHAESPRQAYVQAVLSRGDRRVADLILSGLQSKGGWAKTNKSSPVNTDFYARRERSVEELLPWDFIDHGIDKKFLINEYNRAKDEKTSPPCPMVSCKSCGVCAQYPGD